MRAAVLEAALKALLFAEAWALGWRPGSPDPHVEPGPLALLALERVLRPGLHEALVDEPTEWVRALYEAPAWLASSPRPNPAGLGPEPVPTTLQLLGLVASYRSPTHLGLGAFLLERVARLHRDSGSDPLAVQAGVLASVEGLPLQRAAKILSSRTRLHRHSWATAMALDLSLCRPELVVALHAAQSGGFLLGAALQQLAQLPPPWRVLLVMPLCALFCAAQSPDSTVPQSWSDRLTAQAAAAIDAAAFGRSAERTGDAREG